MLEDDSKQSSSADDISSNQTDSSSESPNPFPVNSVSLEQETEKIEPAAE